MKIGITFSAFDLLHAGHVKMFEECKRNCDYLIAGLQTDPIIYRPQKNKPIQSVLERYIQLKACCHIDETVPCSTESELIDILQVFKIDIRFIGEGYLEKEFTGKQLCIENNIEIFYNSRKHSYSTSGLRAKIKLV
jgi:glycerol-3-phosphate cytidylyltransferase